ncbi:NAD(P)-dependent dehydrogenase, short-chain alcohol dehydrogenase family [Halogranum gelatinilyticum]|uniref:NAD(P)-dependent dehydrogenase, short-chain alcohol dehydrogenase family n=1 Tax=Halogranum gelatinilyticum TaxID=660521 RepID=A0A1G9VNS7_9EURY|nr:SDR family NAD(P)-dependent oxidoreductase [Halogranum gelatinilyticum]SDM73888.1 NAD(P)-dependent dehydrogenase, short-chain alcohol dehydrogenase family [Halogranum gelatinilyticum]
MTYIPRAVRQGHHVLRPLTTRTDADAREFFSVDVDEWSMTAQSVTRADLSDTVALITGASRGVGRGVALELGSAGATVYVTGRSVDDDRTEDLPGTVTETADLVTERGGEGVAVHCDHTVDGDVAALFERIADEQGRLDVLVNNVWGGYEGHDETFADPFWEQSLDRWPGMFDAGVRAHYTATRLAAPTMIEEGDGLVVFVSAGDGEKYRGSVMYDVAKTAVDRMGKAVAHELRPHGVASVVLHPGFVSTERVERAFAEMDEDVPDTTHSPEFVGRAVVALAGDDGVMGKSGGVYKTADLGTEYGFTDVDGSQPEPFYLDTELL